MKGTRYKNNGWHGESHRHYLAAKGISTKRYYARTGPQKKGYKPDIAFDVREKEDAARDKTIASVKVVNEPDVLDKLEREERIAQGKDPDNYVIRVKTDSKGPDTDIQAEEWVKDKARSFGIKTKEEFAQYEKDFVAGAKARGHELKVAEQAVAKFAKSLPAKAKSAYKAEEKFRKKGVDKLNKFRKERERAAEIKAKSQRAQLKKESRELKKEQAQFKETQDEAFADVVRVSR